MKDYIKRWQDWVNLIIGAWLFFSPWILGYDQTSYAWNSFLFGALIVVFSVFALVDRRAWEEWGNLAMGMWLVISPWAIGFSTESTAFLNIIISGVVITGLAIWGIADTLSRWKIKA
ncbi:MAG: SPW repeat protein [bacterium]